MDPVRAARAKRRFAAFVLFVLGTAVLAYFRLRGATLNPDAVREEILGWGPLAPLAFVLLLTIRPFVFFPSTLLFIAAGLAFGPWLGTLCAAAGGTLGAVLSFLIARTLGREFVEARLPPRLQRMHENEWGTGLIFFLNLVPIVPITAVNYASGLSRVPLSLYTVAVVGGLTPRAFAYGFFGDSLLDIGSSQFLAAIAILVVLVVVPTWLRRRWLAGRKGER